MNGDEKAHDAMSYVLWVFTDWEARARLARYCAKKLAQECGVPARTLRRFLRQRFGLCEKEWLRGLRMEAARTALAKGKRVYEVAGELGYASAGQFSRAFKAHHGYAPKEHVRRMNGVGAQGPKWPQMV